MIGFSLDQDTARRLKALTNSEIAFAIGPQIVASTLDPERIAEIDGFANGKGTFRTVIGSEDYDGQAQPLGATGGMLVGTLLDELERRDATRGLVTMCIGGGMGIATIVERV